MLSSKTSVAPHTDGFKIRGKNFESDNLKDRNDELVMRGVG